MHRQLLVDDLLLHVLRQLVPDGVGGVRAVDQDGRAGRRGAQRVELEEKVELVDADEVRRLEQVRRADGPRAKAQVRDRVGAGLLRVVHEVALRVPIWIGRQDDRRVLVRADRAVRPEAEEQRPHDVLRLEIEARVHREARVRHVVVDADGEAMLGPRLLQLVEHRLGHRRIEVLRGQAVAPADDDGHRRHAPRRERLGKRRDDVQVERLAERANLLRAIEDGDPLHRGRQRRQEPGRVPRPVERRHAGRRRAHRAR